MLVEKQGLSLKLRGKIYQCCVIPALLYCYETWELTVTDEVRLRGVERCMIRMMCGERLVDRVWTDVLQESGCHCEDRGYDNSKPPAKVWSCHAWRHQFPNT